MSFLQNCGYIEKVPPVDPARLKLSRDLLLVGQANMKLLLKQISNYLLFLLKDTSKKRFQLFY